MKVQYMLIHVLGIYAYSGSCEYGIILTIGYCLWESKKRMDACKELWTSYSVTNLSWKYMLIHVPWYICLVVMSMNHTHNRPLFCKSEGRAIIGAKKKTVQECWNHSLVKLEMNMNMYSYLFLNIKENTVFWKYGIVLTRSCCLCGGKNSDNCHK